ncbi:MAG: Maf family protein [Lachnospiraceae bacterium]|nr:Maf family protein [Lachnospiraceae bacterium]
MKVILGSASPRRRDILTRAGIEYEVIVSDVEEAVSKTDPAEVVEELSGQKAEDVWDKAVKLYSAKQDDINAYSEDELLVIGADTIVALDGLIYGKPKDRQDAIRMLKNLSGRTHQVYTGVTVIIGGRRISFAAATDVSVYEVSDKEIERYVDSGEPMDKAGAYAIQGGFARYIKEIRGEYNNVVGFPIARLIYELKRLGIDIYS